MKKKIKSILIIVLVVLGGSFIYTQINRQVLKSKYVTSTTPTVFFHGWGSSYRAERQMANYARNHGVTDTIIRANVSKDKEVTFIGEIPEGERNPIILVNLEDNKSTEAGGEDIADMFSKSSEYITAALTAVKQELGYDEVNCVCHSFGNLQLIYSIRNNIGNDSLPQIQKIVDIAGHFNGLIAVDEETATSPLDEETGKPSVMAPEYEALLTLRDNYPTNIQVLNIYGDKGDQTDGPVAVNSARSLRYLVEGRAASYEEKEITGVMGRHSMLHENREVDRCIVSFLWEK